MPESPSFPLKFSHISNSNTDRYLISVFWVYGARIRRSCRFAREADDVGRALAAKTRARIAGEESQIESRITNPSLTDVTHELYRAVSGLPNQAVELTLEKAEAAGKNF